MEAKSDFIVPLSDISAGLSQVGGKGASLALLAEAGFPVPPGFHITTAAYRRFVAENGLQPRILAALQAADVTQLATLETTSANIRDLFTQANVEGKFLRLKQQYFFVSATLQDIIRKYKINHDPFDEFAEKNVIQLNETHPVVAIPELMRILIYQEGLSWVKAWEITNKTFAYTNHTVVPEALEEWSLQLFEELLPRHIQIGVYGINRRFIEDVKKNYTTDTNILSKLSIINEINGKSVRMANLAIVGSFAVNGVAALHTEILKTRIFSHFHKIFPGKFLNRAGPSRPREVRPDRCASRAARP